MFKAFQMPKPEVLNPLKTSGQECFAMALFLLNTYPSSPCLSCSVLRRGRQVVCWLESRLPPNSAHTPEKKKKYHLVHTKSLFAEHRFDFCPPFAEVTAD